ncbi:MAG: hypothetical protein MJ057_00430 [Sphaerochaetaceae bacterium]|nr:hypothetical protein [Sphaerochaetaceae bacterium]
MKKILIVMTVVALVLLSSCATAGKTNAKADATVYVANAVQLQEAVKNKASYIVLTSDIDLLTYTVFNPFILRGGQYTLDLNGHSIRGISSTTGEITNYEQYNQCNFIMKGFGFTIKNGTLVGTGKGGYVLMVNTNDPTRKAAFADITIENIKANGGIDVYYSDVVIRDCVLEQPEACTKNYATVVLQHSNCVLESGSYSNHSSNNYKRFLKILYSDCLIRNGVEYDGTIQYVITSSTLNLEK